MKPARKTRDFSIESILADKRDRNEKSEDVRITNSRRFEECATNASEENCVAFRSAAEEKYEVNSELSEHNFEYKNKSKIRDTQKRTAESDFRNKINISESFEQGSTEIIKNECENSDNFVATQHENNYCKMISSRRDQEGNDKRKSKQDSDQLYDSSKYLNRDLAENRCKNLSFETESKYSSFKNENKETEFSRSKIGTPEVLRDVGKLEWLQCTRYKPPKIPRKPIGKNKRKPSFYPRIPFSMFQLEFLEQKFQNSAYLTRNDVMDISDILKLPPNRIKIWFQNRRARDRREFCTNV